MANAKPSLSVNEIADVYLRDNFRNLQDYFAAQNQLLDFKFFERVFTAAETSVKQSHGLGVTPLDILVTHLSGTGTVKFNYGKFDDSTLDLDVSGPCRIRFFAGRYTQQLSSVQTTPTDAQKFTTGLP